jgi:hypothetical protein
MDPSAFLDMENRLGISDDDVDSFVRKVDAVSTTNLNKATHFFFYIDPFLFCLGFKSY